MKTCCKCKIKKDVNEYTKAKTNKDGLSKRCKSCDKEVHKIWYQNNLDKRREVNRNRYQTLYKEIQKEYRKANKEKNNEYWRLYRIERKKIDINYKLSIYLRTRLYNAIKGNFKNGSAVRDLGCSIDNFIKYIETKFTSGMSWDNYGKWHLDHIIPLNYFDLTDRNQLLKVCNYTNYQPFWALDNIIKGHKYNPQNATHGGPDFSTNNQ